MAGLLDSGIPEGFSSWDEYDAYRKKTGPSMRPSYPGLLTEFVATNPVTKFLVPGAERFLQKGGKPSMFDVGLAGMDIVTPGIPLAATIARRQTSTGLKHLGFKDRPDVKPTVTKWIEEKGVSDAPLKSNEYGTRFHFVKRYHGEYGRKDHLTMAQEGFVSPQGIKHIQGKQGEIRGQHRNMSQEMKAEWKWGKFKDDISEHGIEEPILIIQEPNGVAFIYEGNHRLDAALELGLDKVPVEIRYFGKSEDLGFPYKRKR